MIHFHVLFFGNLIEKIVVKKLDAIMICEFLRDLVTPLPYSLPTEMINCFSIRSTSLYKYRK